MSKHNRGITRRQRYWPSCHIPTLLQAAGSISCMLIRKTNIYKTYHWERPGNPWYQNLHQGLPWKPNTHRGTPLETQKILSPYAIIFIKNCICGIGRILFVILLWVTAVPRHIPHLSAIETPDWLWCSCIPHHILLLWVTRSQSPSFFVNKCTCYIGNGKFILCGCEGGGDIQVGFIEVENKDVGYVCGR